MACHALAVPELLENILLRLHTRDLLFAQKVCKAWKEVMEASPNLQRALFFKPGTCDGAHDDTRIYQAPTRCRHVTGVAPNPLMCFQYKHSTNDSILEEDMLNAHKEASCWRMYITQPPMQIKARFNMWQSRKGKFWNTAVEIESAKGNCGDLIERYWDAVQHNQGLGLKCMHRPRGMLCYGWSKDN
ncbi:hypothetical protein LTR56_016194 [Elasticomyces elasticus]|nr:hypothetical protein LTR56_016194 [Elasticomyces elasticus]KAK3642153.1 hypothetical protein LTR22_016274 [Elasticomyces elasticus]KAK4914201.1 hypothetical protein LTR49_017554 [Elasticomyces elasticus]KAK5762562.1 hypothetical protein LTS12_007353 [Elasticomyces elasticus]